jgi:deferrochelatase/peroxidase EfeB
MRGPRPSNAGRQLRVPGYSYRPVDTPPSIFGEHQPGVDTPLLDHLVVAAFDLQGELKPLLETWSREAERLMARHHSAARDRPAGELTLTLGLGPGPFDGGLAPARPAALAPLPAFDRDALDPALCGGDLCVVACASEREHADTAIRGLAESGGAAPRWTQAGFLRRDPRDAPGARPRDPLGFKDGTHSLRRARDIGRHVWAGSGERTWMVDGTYLVVRRIEVATDEWARLPVAAQERIVGRHRDSGAPLGREREFDSLWLDDPVLPKDAHVRVAAPSTNDGAAMLRRSYTFHDGDSTGLVFLAYQRDPRRQFVPVQRRLSREDAMRRFTTHVGSAVFAIPPGVRPPHEFLGQGLFGTRP